MMSPQMSFLLEANNLHFRYRTQPVIEGVSLAVAPGEMLGVIGPNGSGKSTLVRLLSGVLTPASGKIALDGRALHSYSRRELARRIAVVPQETLIEFPFSVTEVVLMGRSPHLGGFAFESTADVQVAHAAMQRTGVLDLQHRSIHELSGGERQRVILARALAQEASVMLLDEPAAFLDIRHQVDTYDLLHELQNEGTGIITVLHDLNLATLYCDRVILLKAGSAVATGQPADVITYAAIKDVYDTEVYVDVNDVTGAVNVLPLSRKYRQALQAKTTNRQT